MGQIIAALDIGTSKSIALVVQKDFWGKLSVLQTETLPSKGAIRRGRIFNSDDTADIISKLIRKLNNNPDFPIEKIYVGIGGQSLHTQLFIVKRIVENGTVSKQLIESMEQEANSYKPELEENLGVFSCEFYVDRQLVANPKGTMASVIEARFQLVVGNPCLKHNIEKMFDGKEISVAGYFISPLATAEAVLTPEEKELGCALVEWGEGVTYVSVYKNKALKYLATIPLGGLAITLDIRSLNVEENEAEALKIKYGSAMSNPDDNDEAPVNEDQISPRKIKIKDLNWIIEARVDEIVKNIWRQIQLSEYSQSLDAGIVITGGGALLRNLPQYIQNQTGKSVRLANAKVLKNQVETQLSPAESCVVGLTVLGKDSCVKAITVDIFDPVKEKKPENIQKKPEKPPKTDDGKSFRQKFRRLIARGTEIVDEGARLFADEDFENKTTKPVDNNSAEIRDKNNNSTNNTNKQ